MFRSLFGTTASGGDHTAESEGRDEKNAPTSKAMKSVKSTANAGSTGGKTGGFFGLDPKEVAPEESLFDDLDLKPPTATASNTAQGGTSVVPEQSVDAGGMFSAFQFMSSQAEGNPVPSILDADAGGSSVSAFSFLANTSSSNLETVSNGVIGNDGEPVETVPQTSPPASADDAALHIPEAASELPRSPLSANGVRAPASTASTALNTEGASETGHGGYAVMMPPDKSSQNDAGTTSRRDDRQSTSSLTSVISTGDARRAAGSVVRKKRTARRVGYARDEPSSPGPDPSLTATSGRPGEEVSDSSKQDVPLANRPPSASHGDVAGPCVSIARETLAGSGSPSIKDEHDGSHFSSPQAHDDRIINHSPSMDDSIVAEAAAMAALAASMAPGEMPESKKVPMRGTGVVSGMNNTSSTSASEGADGIVKKPESVTRCVSSESRHGSSHGSESTPMPTSRPTSMRKSTSFMRKFKGLLGAPKAGEHEGAAPSPSSELSDEAVDEAPESSREYISPTITTADSEASESGIAETEGKSGVGGQRGHDEVAERVQAELSFLVKTIQDESTALSEELAKSAAARKALEVERTALLEREADSNRQLVETESEQQRLADAEEYEKAAELSMDIDRLHKEGEATSNRLRELDNEERALQSTSSSGREKLLGAVGRAADELKAFQKKQDGNLSKLVVERSAIFEAESRRITTEAERISLEKMHVERDKLHLQEEQAQTEKAISAQTGGEDERLSSLALMRLELEGEVKDLETQLEAKKAALQEVLNGVTQTEKRIESVRGKFERQLARLRERERLVAISEDDCRQEEMSLDSDKATHRVTKEKAMMEQQELHRVVEGVAEEIVIARILQATLSSHWEGESGGVCDADEDTRGGDDVDESKASLSHLRAEVDGARFKHEEVVREITTLESKRDFLRAERISTVEALPRLEQEKRAAVLAKDYKAAGQFSRQMKELEKRQHEVSDELAGIDTRVAEGSDTRQELHKTEQDLASALEALRVAEEAVDVGRVSILGKRARALRRARRSVEQQGGTAGLRQMAIDLFNLQIASLESDANEIGKRHGLHVEDFSVWTEGDHAESEEEGADGDHGVQSAASIEERQEEDGPLPTDSDDQENNDESRNVRCRRERATGSESDLYGSAESSTQGIQDDKDQCPGGFSVNSSTKDDPAIAAARGLLEAETAEVERELAELQEQLDEALQEEDYDKATELDEQMEQVRARLAEFTSETVSLVRSTGGVTAAAVMPSVPNADMDTTHDADVSGIQPSCLKIDKEGVDESSTPGEPIQSLDACPLIKRTPDSGQMGSADAEIINPADPSDTSLPHTASVQSDRLTESGRTEDVSPGLMSTRNEGVNEDDPRRLDASNHNATSLVSTFDQMHEGDETAVDEDLNAEEMIARGGANASREMVGEVHGDTQGDDADNGRFQVALNADSDRDAPDTREQAAVEYDSTGNASFGGDVRAEMMVDIGSARDHPADQGAKESDVHDEQFAASSLATPEGLDVDGGSANSVSSANDTESGHRKTDLLGDDASAGMPVLSALSFINSDRTGSVSPTGNNVEDALAKGHPQTASTETTTVDGSSSASSLAGRKECQAVRDAPDSDVMNDDQITSSASACMTSPQADTEGQEGSDRDDERASYADR